MALKYDVIHEDWWGKRRIVSRHHTKAAAQKVARREVSKAPGAARRALVRDRSAQVPIVVDVFSARTLGKDAKAKK